MKTPTFSRWMMVWGAAIGMAVASVGRAGSDSIPLPRLSVYAPRAVVAASHPLASQAGLEMLQRGGNAIDAAVAAAAVMNVVEPSTSGLGGDLFALLWIEKEQRLVGLNASGRSGSLLTVEALRAAGHTEMPEAGAASVTVPGTLSGWVALLEKYGKLQLADVLAPAIRIARDGFPLSPRTAEFWAAAESSLADDPATRKVFQTAAGRPPRVGEWQTNADFAQTLSALAANGPGWLYGGELGAQVVEYLRRQGGFLTLDDLRNHRAEWVEPMAAAFGDFKLWELPPNGQGIAALEMLRLLDPETLRAAGRNSPAYLHALIEAKKVAYADLEAFIGDPATMTGPAARLLDDAFIAQRRALIDPARAAERVEPGAAFTRSDTTYLNSADAEGNMVSLITSLCGFYGSGVVVPGTGFALQNRGVGFTMTANRPNTAAPGRRPFHTIIPGFITRAGKDGRDEPWGPIGIMGGANQPQAHVQVMLNLVLWNMDSQSAIDAPRFRHLGGRKVVFDPRLPAEVVAALVERGHDSVPKGDYADGDRFGTGHLIRRLAKGYEAGSDSRSDGLPAGY